MRLGVQKFSYFQMLFLARRSMRRCHSTAGKAFKSLPIEKYNGYVKKGLVRPDRHQVEALLQLGKLHEELYAYEQRLSTLAPNTATTTATSTQSSTWFSGLFTLQTNQSISTKKSSSSFTQEAPKSFYIYGGTGTGKTFLMDLFYENLTFIKRKRRIHYSNFMLDIHQRLHSLKMVRGKDTQNLPGPSRARGGGRGGKVQSSVDNDVHEVWEKIVSDIYHESYFICLDEFQVTDIADAVILKNLFASLFDKGVVVIMTSNRPPKDLYQNGLQRELFLPFIDLVQRRAIVHSIVDSTTDYRVLKQREQQGKVCISYHLRFQYQ